jgi:hypothetical protein
MQPQIFSFSHPVAFQPPAPGVQFVTYAPQQPSYQFVPVQLLQQTPTNVGLPVFAPFQPYSPHDPLMHSSFQLSLLGSAATSMDGNQQQQQQQRPL